MSSPNHNGRHDRKYIKLLNHTSGEVSEDRLVFSTLPSSKNGNNNNNNFIAVNGNVDVIDGKGKCPVYQVNILSTSTISKTIRLSFAHT